MNSKDRILDLCWSNSPAVVKRSLALVQEDGYHPALSVATDLNTIKEEAYSSYCFDQGDCNGFSRFLLNINWMELYQLNTIEDKVNYLYDVIS